MWLNPALTRVNSFVQNELPPYPPQIVLPDSRAWAAFYDSNDVTSMFVARDATGGNPGTGQPVGVWLDKMHMGELTATEYLAINAISDPLQAPGNRACYRCASTFCHWRRSA